MEDILRNIRLHIQTLCKEKEQVLIAIDGRCGAGKTTLADRLQQTIECNVIHMDDFFLRPEQRTIERMNKAGENVDDERFEQEVLRPLQLKQAFFYRPYDCKTQKLQSGIYVRPRQVNIMEGSYRCHPNLSPYYDLKIFLTVDRKLQLQRIAGRNGGVSIELFREKWIPLEENYFLTYDIEKTCDLSFQT